MEHTHTLNRAHHLRRNEKEITDVRLVKGSISQSSRYGVKAVVVPSEQEQEQEGTCGPTEGGQRPRRTPTPPKEAFFGPKRLVRDS